MYKWYNSGNEQGRKKIDEHGIGDDVLGIAAQLAGDDGTCCGSRAYEADHPPFQYNAHAAVGQSRQHSSESHKHAALEGQKPPMVTAKTQLAGIYLAECEKEHGKDEQRLHRFHTAQYQIVGGCTQMSGMAKEIACHTAENGENKDPVLDEFQQSHDVGDGILLYRRVSPV